MAKGDNNQNKYRWMNNLNGLNNGQNQSQDIHSVDRNMEPYTNPNAGQAPHIITAGDHQTFLDPNSIFNKMGGINPGLNSSLDQSNNPNPKKPRIIF